MENLAQSMKAFADPTRLRLLRLLAAEALSVGEATTILGVAQPTVSKQLGALRRAGLVREERNGSFAFYRLDAAGDPLWPAVAARMDGEGDSHGDLSRLAEVVRRRSDRGLSRSRCLEPGRSWPAWARALGRLIPPLRVADLGCGDGALTAEIARWARSVVAVDRDGERLAAARRRLASQGGRRVRFLQENLSRLSLADGCVDLVVLSQALHHDGVPGPVLAEAARILAPGGRLLVLDLARHREIWVQDKLGHARLGFTAEELAAAARGAGFSRIETEIMPKGPGDPFSILMLTGHRSPAGRRGTAPRHTESSGRPYRKRQA